MARIIARRETALSQWVRVVETTVELDPNAPPETFHSFAQADYVTVIARTASGLIPIVSQFRPAVGCVTWELPGGLLDSDEDPETCCRRELTEETGVQVTSIRFLGTLFPDTGRLSNRAHVFAAETTDPDPSYEPEPGMAVAFVTPAELRARVLDGSFGHLLHVGVLGLAAVHGFDVKLFAD